MNIYCGIIKVVKKKHARFLQVVFPAFIVSLALSFAGMSYITLTMIFQHCSPITDEIAQ
jgi:hypothetical protein